MSGERGDVGATNDAYGDDAPRRPVGLADDDGGLNAGTSDVAELTVPVLDEALVVGRRTHELGGVRLHRSVHERVAIVDEPLIRERVVVERVTVNRPLADGDVPEPHEHDGVLIVPVVEEVLVVERRRMLTEELHVCRVREEWRERHEVPLKREHVDVERFEADDDATPERGIP